MTIPGAVPRRTKSLKRLQHWFMQNTNVTTLPRNGRQRLMRQRRSQYKQKCQQPRDSSTSAICWVPTTKRLHRGSSQRLQMSPVLSCLAHSFVSFLNIGEKLLADGGMIQRLSAFDALRAVQIVIAVVGVMIILVDGGITTATQDTLEFWRTLKASHVCFTASGSRRFSLSMFCVIPVHLNLCTLKSPLMYFYQNFADLALWSLQRYARIVDVPVGL
uniref:7TM_GPCR_Srx domain-containing protein n=1 Tax=Steinernema glaseri TaxID=37863 RepID=A0A1I7Y8C1_9BILA